MTPVAAPLAPARSLPQPRRRGRPRREGPRPEQAVEDPVLRALAASAQALVSALRLATFETAPVAATRAWAEAGRAAGISTVRLRSALELLVHEHVGARDADERLLRVLAAVAG